MMIMMMMMMMIMMVDIGAIMMIMMKWGMKLGGGTLDLNGERESNLAFTFV